MYPITASSCSAGTAILRFAASAVTDAAGNATSLTDGPTVTIERTPPAVTFDLQAASDSGPLNTDNLTNVASPIFDATFTEAISGFTPIDLTNMGTASGCIFSVGTPAGNKYPVTVSSCSGGTLTLRIAAAGVMDIAGNNIQVTDGPEVTIDRTAPTLGLDLQTGSDTGILNTDHLTNASNLVFDATFNEAVSGFSATGLSNTGTAGGCTFSIGSPTGNVYPVTASACSEGTVAVREAASGLMDMAGNLNIQTDSPVVNIDRTGPTTGMNSTASNPTGMSPIPVTVTFSEPVFLFISSDISITNGSVANFSGSGSGYLFDLYPGGLGTVSADIHAGVAEDAAGNGNTAAVYPQPGL